MATTDEIARLRRLINEPTADTYSDADLALRIDNTVGGIDAVAADVWREKAASFAVLVNVTEGPSSRDLGSLYKNAIEMANFFEAESVEDTPTNIARTRRAVREGGF